MNFNNIAYTDFCPICKKTLIQEFDAFYCDGHYMYMKGGTYKLNYVYLKLNNYSVIRCTPNEILICNNVYLDKDFMNSIDNKFVPATLMNFSILNKSANIYDFINKINNLMLFV